MKRPQVTCCSPSRRPFPSGWAWAHSVSCKVNPRGRIATSQAASLETMRRVGLEKAETARAGVVTLDAPTWTLIGDVWKRTDEAPLSTDDRMATWRSHPVDCDCIEACRYVNAHLDGEL